MAARRVSPTLAYYLTFLNVILMCVLYPPFWLVFGAAIVVYWAAKAIRYMHKNYDPVFVANFIDGCLGITLFLGLCCFGATNALWAICSFKGDEKMCDAVCYTYYVDVALLVVLAWPMAMWVAK